MNAEKTNIYIILLIIFSDLFHKLHLAVTPLSDHKIIRDTK